MSKLYLEDEVFGPLISLIKNDNVTDINWNGADLWVDDINKGRYLEQEISLTPLFIEQFALKVSNLMNESFNQYYPVLEAETETLRLSVLHESRTNTGTSLSIRKSLPYRRMDRDKMLTNQFCPEAIDNFMQNAVKAHLNVFVSGLTGVGKTEYVKTLTEYIPAYERAITIEDNLEIRYRQINPGKDCIEIRVGDTLSYSDAIKASLRQFPTWILLSEARGEEVVELMKSLSTGAYCMTTGHTNDVLKIPSRILNMMGEHVTENTINDVYSSIDIGILIKAERLPNQKQKRWLAQLALFSNENGENVISMIYDGETINEDAIPADIKQKFKDAGISNPFILKQPK